MNHTILVTGGTGYIGSHTVVDLLNSGYHPVILDNLCNSSALVLDRIHEITGHSATFVHGDIRDRALLDRIFAEHPIQAVIHFAGLKAVGESTQIPLAYYENNVVGTLCLLEAMKKSGCRNLVFSSSATVYGTPETVPIHETAPLSATNPYGRSKLMIEDICRDLAAAEHDWHIALLRYFNPVGAHPSGKIGEAPNGIPNNLMPYLLQVAVGRRECLTVHGNNYPTPDGTGVRDYIHVVDLAQGHIAALNAIERVQGAVPINLGTGQGYSVLQMIQALEETIQKPVPYRLGPRRPGDIACCYANIDRAKEILNWAAKQGIREMHADSWKWQCMNPCGYETEPARA